MCLSSRLWGGGFLDCDSQFTIMGPPSFDRPQLWRFTSLCSSLYLLTRAHCPQCFPSIPLWLASCLIAPAGGQNHLKVNLRKMHALLLLRAKCCTTLKPSPFNAWSGWSSLWKPGLLLMILSVCMFVCKAAIWLITHPRSWKRILVGFWFGPGFWFWLVLIIFFDSRVFIKE